MSNTSNGFASKGSKLWIQILVNLYSGKVLNEAIQAEDPTIVDIEWLSPLSSENYEEYKLNRGNALNKIDFPIRAFAFWPENQPQWDALAWATDAAGKKTLLLVEAKAHTKETKSSCTATADASIQLIRKSMQEAKDSLPKAGTVNISVWEKDYYQLGNRLTFLHFLKQNADFGVKLVLVSFVNDASHIRKSMEEWQRHNNEMFDAVTGNMHPPEDVIVVNLPVQ